MYFSKVSAFSQFIANKLENEEESFPITRKKHISRLRKTEFLVTAPSTMET